MRTQLGESGFYVTICESSPIVLMYRFLSAEEDIVTDYKFNVYDLLVLPPSFPYGGMVCQFIRGKSRLSVFILRKMHACHS